MASISNLTHKLQEGDEDDTAALWSQYEPVDFQDAPEDENDTTSGGPACNSVHSYKIRLISQIEATGGMKAGDLFDTDIIPKTETNEPKDAIDWGILLLAALADTVNYTSDIQWMNLVVRQAVQRRFKKGKSKREYMTYVTVREANDKLHDRNLELEAEKIE